MPQVRIGSRRRLREGHQVHWRCKGAVLGGALALATAGAEPARTQVTYTVFPPHAGRASVQPEPRVTLRVQDSTVAYTVRALVHQAHMRLLYDIDNPGFARRVSVDVTSTAVMDALAMVLQGTGLVARMAPDGETIVVRGAADVAEGRKRQQGGTVSGRVADSTTGAGLQGAQVRVEGVAKLTAVTSDSGNFVLRNVPAGDQVLQVRLFGYRPVARQVTVVDGERTTVRIAMAGVPTVLSGVVTTATGMQRKVELGNDITTINVDSVMRVAPVSTVTDLLETRVPSVTVVHSSGAPGSPSRVRIRGVGSITGNNDPIVVVDGIRVYASQSDPRNVNLARSAYGVGGGASGAGAVTVANPGGGDLSGVGANTGTAYSAPSPLDQIDPNSIETIEVFKGPSASALYGSDAANGVIVITTKHGHAGPTHWNLALGQGVNWLPGNWPTNYYRFGHPRPEVSASNQNFGGTGFCIWYDLSCQTDSIVGFQALNDSRFSLFSHGMDQTAALTVSGGVQTLQYSLTGSAATNVGNLKLDQWDRRLYELAYGPVPGWMLRPDNYKTYGLTGELTAQPAHTVRATFQSSLFNSDQQQGSLQSGITQLESEYIGTNGDSLVRQNTISSTFGGPGVGQLLQNEVERATAGTLTSTNALTLNWQALPWLPVNATGGFSTVQRVNQTYIPYGISANGVGVGANIVDTTGSYGLGRGTSMNRTLTVGTTLPARFVTTAVGANLTSESTSDFSAYTSHLAPGVSTPTQFLYTNGGPSQTTTAWSTYGWYVEPRLNLNSRFFVSPGFRLDGGSASGAHAGLTGFPKIDLSYVAVDRSSPLGPLSLFRPRFAVGVAGTQPSPTAKLRILNQGGGQSVVLNSTTALPEVVISTIGNTKLRPETSREFEGGVDAELWQGRLTVTATGYHKTRYNAIIDIPLAPSIGVGLDQSVNVGVVRNTGLEFTAIAQVLESRSMSWYVGANVSNDNNRVVRLNAGFTPNKDLGIVAGYPLFGTWTRPIVAYNDANHDGTIGLTEYQVADSLVFAGQANPKYQMNVNTGLQLLDGRLSVNATFAYQNGLTQTNQGLIQSQGIQLLANTPGVSLGTKAAIMAAACEPTNASFGGCTPSTVGIIQTVNTFRFNELSINYTLPTGVTQWLHVPRAALALQGSNLGLHTNYRGFDPNVNAFSTADGGDQIQDNGQLPQPRVWWLKLNLGN